MTPLYIFSVLLIGAILGVVTLVYLLYRHWLKNGGVDPASFSAYDIENMNIADPDTNWTPKKLKKNEAKIKKLCGKSY